MKRFRIETYGCAVNKADSESMAGLLLENGFSLEETEGDDPGRGILIINTCTVKTPTDNKIIRRLKELKGSKVIVCGCLPAASPQVAERFLDFSFIGVNIEDIVDAAEKTLAGERFVNIRETKGCMDMPIRKINPLVGIVPICRGCLGDCTYCITRFARGGLVSYSSDRIVERVSELVSSGCLEIWLTAQDTGAYGLDMGDSLPSLLRRVCEIPGDFKIRVGMMNPLYALRFLPELIEAYSDDKVYKFLHLPLQSGDDQVLSEMHRRYTSEDFRRIVSEFKAAVPGLTLSTDVIAGFPTEDDFAFQNTVDLIREVKPEVMNLSRFWLRPNTPASRLPHVPGHVTKKRSRVLADLFEKIGLECNQKWIGWTGEAVVSETARNGFCARNDSYKPIIIRSSEDLLGKKVRVEITDATSFDLRARIL